MAIQFDTAVQRTLQVGFTAFSQGIDGACQQFAVEAEADLLNLSALILTEQFSGTSNFHVVCGQRKTGAKLFQ